MSTRVIYNNILLDHCQTLDYVKEPIYDGPTLLYLKYTIRVVGIYNPGITAYTRTGALVKFSTGAMAPRTEQAVYWRLSQPRKTLIYVIGGTVNLNNPLIPTVTGGTELIRSPATNAFRDAANGPFVTVHQIDEVHGERTFKVSLTITTCVNATSTEHINGTASVILSHRWRMFDDIDQDGFCVRTVQGRAVFRSDRLLTLDLRPDDFREFLVHPVSDGFKRASIQAVATEDGTELEYQTTDRQLAISIVSKLGVSRIEAFQTIGNKHYGFEQAATTAISAILGAVRRGAADIAGAFSLDPIASGSRIAQASVNMATDTAAAAFNFGRNLIPRRYTNIVIRVWGFPNSRRQDLLDVAWTIFNARMPFGGASFFFESDVSYTEDIVGKFVEVQGTYMAGPVTSIALFAGSAPGLTLTGTLPEDIPSTLSTAPRPQLLVNGRGSRGTYLAGLAAQVLLDSVETTPAPTIPANAVESTPP